MLRPVENERATRQAQGRSMPSENDNEIRLEDGGWFNKDTSKVWAGKEGEKLFLTQKGGWILCEHSPTMLIGSSYRNISQREAARWFRKTGLDMPGSLHALDKQEEV